MLDQLKGSKGGSSSPLHQHFGQMPQPRWSSPRHLAKRCFDRDWGEFILEAFYSPEQDRTGTFWAVEVTGPFAALWAALGEDVGLAVVIESTPTVPHTHRAHFLATSWALESRDKQRNEPNGDKSAGDCPPQEQQETRAYKGW